MRLLPSESRNKVVNDDAGLSGLLKNELLDVRRQIADNQRVANDWLKKLKEARNQHAAFIEKIEKEKTDYLDDWEKRRGEKEAEIKLLKEKIEALESSADAKKYKKLVQEAKDQTDQLEQERAFFKDRLADVESKQETVAKALLEIDAREDELASQRESLDIKKSAWEKKAASIDADLKARLENLEKSEKDLVEHEGRIVEREDEAEALRQSTLTFKETLEKERESVMRERTAIQDAYRELARARREILGRDA